MTGRREAATLGPIPTLSIIIPAFNAGRYISSCIESVLAQSYADFEVLVVNDGSTDGTADILDMYASRDSRIHVIHVENSGPSAARNAGLAVARGTYVQFVDADDTLHPSCCEAFRDAALENAADLQICSAVVVDSISRVVASTCLPGDGVYSADTLLAALTPASKATLLHYVWNKWYRLELIRAASLEFDRALRLGEDFVFNCSYWSLCSTVGLLDKPLYRYFKRYESSLTAQFNVAELDRRRRMDRGLFSLYEERGLLTECCDMLSEIVGSIAFDSMSRVALPGCPLTKRDRLRYVRDFIQSEYREPMLQFAASGHAGTIHRVQGFLVRHSCTKALYGFISAVAVARRVFRTVGLAQAAPGRF